MAYDVTVVGQDKGLMRERIQSITKAAKRRDQEIEGEEAERDRREKALEVQKLKEREAALGKCKDWDVRGKWKIDCPHIMEQWGNEVEDITMDIYIQNSSKGPQMFSKFNFEVLEGVMRFERQPTDKPRPKTAVNVKPTPKAGQKRQREDDSDGGDEGRYGDYDEDSDDEDEDEDRRSPTPEAFYLGSTSQPSAKHPTWNYRYCASETGEGEIQLFEDQKVYQITFGSKGLTLKGNIGASMFETCSFTGIKVEMGGEETIDIAEEWAEHSEVAYYRASKW